MEVSLKSGRYDEAPGQILSLAGTPLGHCHVCAFFNSLDEQYQVLAPFFREALQQGEQLLLLVDDAAAVDEHRDRLSTLGWDPLQLEASRRLLLLTWASMGGSPHRPPAPAQLLSAIGHLTGEGRSREFPRLRIVAQMDGLLRHSPDRLEIVAFAAEVDELLMRHGQPMIGAHDIATLDGATMMDLLRTHPLTLIGGRLQENPFFTPPTDMLRELAARRGRGVDARDLALR